MSESSSSPVRDFLDWDAAAGVLLIAAAVLAMAWANSPWADMYLNLRQLPISFSFGDEGLSKPLLLWVNEGLMALFFFLIGLEVKREIIDGGLSSMRQAALPLFAAAGGMLFPFAFFLLFNNDPAGTDAWGVTIATDIAFSLGILSLLGRRAPEGLVLFLAAFAIVDDIGAILVIALYYAHEVHFPSVAVAGALVGVLLLCNHVLDIKRNFIYLVLGLGVWYYTFKSGIHPTIAGVVVAFTIPARHAINRSLFVDSIRRFMRKTQEQEDGLPFSRQFRQEQELYELRQLKHNLKSVTPPLQRLEVRLEELVSYFIIPLFVFANAGIPLADGLESISGRFTLSVAGALVLGKSAGIFFTSWLGVKLGLAQLPAHTRWMHILGVALLAGIGFTMSMFIANLALTDAALLTQARLGILLASLLAAVGGYMVLHRSLPPG